jgi:glycosyltransferase involved in cell wall biosynthesis
MWVLRTSSEQQPQHRSLHWWNAWLTMPPSDLMADGRRILLLGGTFSGVTASLQAALERQGHVVVCHRPSLRPLGMLRPLHALAMAAEAIADYGTTFPRYLRRTAAANRAYASATGRVVHGMQGVDVVIQIGMNHASYWGSRRPGTLYATYTDHTNLLSKQLPDFGVPLPQREVKQSWNVIEKSNLLHQDHIFVMGSHVKQSMVDDYQVPPERISVVGAGPNAGVDIDRDRREKNYSGRNVLFVGLDPARKGLPALKEAFRKVRVVLPGSTLHVVGTTGTDEADIIHYGEVRGARLRDHFYDAQLFVMPSLREPFGIAFVEAMWSRAVCIGPSIEAVPEIIEHGVTGHLVKPNDVDAIATSIIQLLGNPQLLKTYADNAYEKAIRKWSWDKVAARIMTQLDRLDPRSSSRRE